MKTVAQFLQMMNLGFLHENYQFEGAFVFNTEMASGHNFSSFFKFFLVFLLKDLSVAAMREVQTIEFKQNKAGKVFEGSN